MRVLLGTLLVCVCLCTAALHAVSMSPARVERAVYLMGTRATLVTFAADRAAGLQRLERMVRVIEDTEAELSTWRDDSRLSALNRQPVAVPWRASGSLCRLFDRIVAWHRETAGAFDPAIGSLIEAWGLRRGGRRPSAIELAAAAANAGLRHIEFDPTTCTVTRRVAATLDAGAFGKGAALARVLRAARAGSPAAWRVDLGGQIAVFGSPASGGWPVALAHPRWRDEPALDLVLETGSLATTGGSERDRLADGARIGHVLDPRTAHTVTRRASATVWHEDPLVADVLSTAIYVMGVDDGLAFAEARGLAACFLVPGDEGGARGVELRATTAFHRRFVRRAS